MKTINFQAPIYGNGNFKNRENAALEGMRQGLNTLASTPKNAYNSWKDEEDNKRKWDEMIDEKNYRRERDRIADERYNEELARRIAEENRVAAERKARMESIRRLQQQNEEYWGQGGEAYDFDANDAYLDRLQHDYETGGVDNARSIMYGRDVNGAKTRARNMVASDSDYDTIRAAANGSYAPNGYVGRYNGPSRRGEVSYPDLSRYGEGAMMAYQMMQQASNPEDYYAAQNQLNTIIMQRNMAESQRAESDAVKLQNSQDDEIVNGIAMHPVMSTLNRISAGMPSKDYSAEDIQGFMNTLESMQNKVLWIKDPTKRMEAQSKIDKAMGQFGKLYGAKTAPGFRRM